MMCPYCGADTEYKMFSGGREWYCPDCESQGDYPEEAAGLPRATLLRTEFGRAVLQAQMDQELARRRES